MKGRLVQLIRFFIPLSLLFALLFVLLRIYEFWMMPGSDNAAYEFSGILYDLSFSFALMVPVLIMGSLLSLAHVKTARVAVMISYFVILFVSFGLVQYFTETHVPLSADLFGYSMQDIKTTVSASAGLNIAAISFLFVYLGSFVVGSLLISRKIDSISLSTRTAIVSVVLILILAFIPVRPGREKFKQDIQYNLTISKPRYFVDRTVSYLNENRVLESYQRNLPPDSYPFLHTVRYEDVLGKYFTTGSTPPNLVFILVEGLGRDFTGPNAQFGGFTPFLDSLATQSLYWKNGLSNAGRTFGALPSVLGSLPYGKEGFMSCGSKMPDHQTLVSLLKPYGYRSNFFYGGNPNFDNQDVFLNYQGIDYMLNESNFPSAYRRSERNSEGFSWGYADRDVFNCSLEVIDEKNRSPRLDVYLTLSTHEPFIVPEDKFEKEFEDRLAAVTANEAHKSVYRDYRNIFSCLLYSDQALKEFFRQYKSRLEYSNTIFIITGDHRLIPVPQATRISRFHVPIMIFSPMLKAPQMFASVTLHSDILPSVLAFLKKNYRMDFPEQMPFISDGLSIEEDFISNTHLALIRNKGEVNDYIDGEYFLSEDRLYRIQPNLDLESCDSSSLRGKLSDALMDFKARSAFACENNRLDRPSTKRHLQLFSFNDSESRIIKDEDLDSFAPDQLFEKARTLAFAKQYEECRVILKVLLNESPNYHDARILLARTFAWNAQYDTARYFLKQVLEKSTGYDDAYNASADIEFWEGDAHQSLALAEKGLEFNPGNADLMARQARALWMLGKKGEAKKIVEAVLKKSPQHELALDIQQKIRS